MSVTKGNWPGGAAGHGWMTLGPLDTTGKVFWVSSTSANAKDDSSHGGSPEYPWATWAYASANAHGKLVASRGDQINLMPGHAESVIAAAGIACGVAGVRVQGWGEGNMRPTITISTATTADIDIDAANVTIDNVVFVCAIDSMAAGIDVNSTDFKINRCLFKESSATGLTWIDINGGSANACDRAVITNNQFWCVTAANWDRAIELGEVADGVMIANNVIMGDFDDAGIHNITGKVLTNLVITDNWVQNVQTGDHAIELVSACTGIATGNYCITDTNTIAFDAGALSCARNFWLNSAGGDTEGGPVNPLEDQATNFIGVDDNNNAVATTNVVANEDGSVLERLEQIQEVVNNGTGTSVASNKSLVDCLGTTGSAVSDSAVSVLGAIGADNANNAFSSTSVVANKDGSVLERLEAIHDVTGAYIPNFGYRVQKTQDLASDPDNLFDVTGTICITLLVGEVTTVIATTTTVLLELASGAPLCAATTITTDADGTMYVLGGDVGDVLNSAETPVVGLASLNGKQTMVIVGNSGGSEIIRAQLDGAGTGAILWTMYYFPITSGGTVTASA